MTTETAQPKINAARIESSAKVIRHRLAYHHCSHRNSTCLKAWASWRIPLSTFRHPIPRRRNNRLEATVSNNCELN